MAGICIGQYTHEGKLVKIFAYPPDESGLEIDIEEGNHTANGPRYTRASLVKMVGDTERFTDWPIISKIVKAAFKGRNFASLALRVRKYREKHKCQS